MSNATESLSDRISRELDREDMDAHPRHDAALDRLRADIAAASPAQMGKMFAIADEPDGSDVGDRWDGCE